MHHANEIQNGPAWVQCPIPIVETAKMRLDTEVITAERLSSGRPGELNLSGSQVLVGCVSALCTAGVLLWALINLWLFEP